MKTRGCVTLLVMGAWLAHASFAGEPAAPPKSGDALRAAAEAHARAKAQSRKEKELAADRAQTQARLDAVLQKKDADRQAALQAQATRVQEAAGVQAKTYLEPFRERLDLEIHYIERTCGLTDDQAAALRKHGAEITERAQTDLAKALAAQAGQPRQAVVIVNGNAVAVPAGINVDYLMDPAQVVRRELLRAGADALPADARPKLDKADEERHQRALAATRLGALIVLDEALLLSTPQRDAIAQLLDAAWTVPVAAGRNPFLAGPPHAAEMLHSACLILPDGKLDNILRPIQHAALKSLFETAAQLAGQPRGMKMARRMGGGAMGGGMMGGGMMGGMGMQGANTPAGMGMKRRAPAVVFNRVMAEARPANAGVQRNVHGAQHGVVVESGDGAARLANYLELAVDDVAAACGLSDEQRAKLLLAGRLDLKRIAPKIEDDAIQDVGVNQAAGIVGQVRIVGQANGAAGDVVIQADEVRFDAASKQASLFTDRSSAYQKVLRGKLSEEQRQRLSAARCERLAMHQRGVVAAVLQAIDERVLLSDQQYQRLTDFLEVPIANDRPMGLSGNPRDQVLARLARISSRELEPMFDDVQRPLAARFWQELWATVPLEVGPVLENREAR